jgi:O-antigen ligase
LVVIAAIMPLYVVRFHFGPLPTTLLEIAVLVTVAAYVLAAVAGQAPRPGWTPFEIPIGLFLVAGVIGIVVAPDHRSALGIFRAYLVEPIALFYVAIAVLDLDRWMKAFLVSGAVGALVFAVIEINTVATSFAAGTLDIAHAAAALGINPNSVALYIEPLIAFSAAFFLLAPGKQRLLTGPLLLVLVAAAVASFSRGALAAIGVLMVIVLVSVHRAAPRIAVGAATAVGLLLLWQVPPVRLRLIYLFADRTGSVYTRQHVWAESLRMLRDHPLFGAGISGYQTVMAPYRAVDPYNVPEPYAHNLLLSTWSELGLLGLLAFGWILGVLVVRPWLALKRAVGIQVPLLWGTAAAFAMLMAHGTVDTPYWKNDLSAEFWLLAAVQTVAIRATRE